MSKNSMHTPYFKDTLVLKNANRHRSLQRVLTFLPGEGLALVLTLLPGQVVAAGGLVAVALS